MEYEFLKSLILIFGVSALVVFALGRLRVPSVVGFLVAGVILGPHGLKLIQDVAEVESLAEIGVVLLMFTIGLEFSFKNLLMLRTAALGGGFVQVSLTVAAAAALSYLFFPSGPETAVFNGFLVALSSTAIAMKLLMDRAEINTPYGRASVGMLIFQDLCVVPFMLLVPILAGKGGGFAGLALSIAKSLAVIGAVFVSARWVVPFALREVVKSRSRELFVITIILLCLGTAFLTFKLGLSLALGAFLAGVLISESEYASQAIADILPFKESFTGLFFISVGMLLNLGYLRENIGAVAAIVSSILILKFITSAAAASLTGQSLRNALMSGAYLSQIGEFSFVLAVSGRAHGLITEETYQTFLSASVMTMLLTPFLVAVSPSLVPWLVSRPLMKRMDRSRRMSKASDFSVKRKDHVIVVGFGVNGRNLARVLREAGIPYVVLEMNPGVVGKMKKKGEPIFYGDGASVEILQRLGIHAARALVVAISDPSATRRMVQIARTATPALYIIVRTRFVSEVEGLKQLGANEVIPEEFETSVEIFSRVLHHYQVPRNVISDLTDGVRKDSYRLLRALDLPAKRLAERHEILDSIETELYLIKEGSRMEGLSIKDSRFRTETGCTIIAVRREGKIIQNPEPDFVFNRGDALLLIGRREDLNRAARAIDEGRGQEAAI